MLEKNISKNQTLVADNSATVTNVNTTPSPVAKKPAAQTVETKATEAKKPANAETRAAVAGVKKAERAQQAEARAQKIESRKAERAEDAEIRAQKIESRKAERAKEAEERARKIESRRVAKAHAATVKAQITALEKAEKQQQRVQREVKIKTKELLRNLRKLEARGFAGIPDRIINAFFSILTSALVVLYSLFGTEFIGIDVDVLAEKFFSAADGVMNTVGAWGVAAIIFIFFSLLSKSSLNIPKFLKKLTGSPELALSATMLATLPAAFEDGSISEVIVVVLAFGLILHACFASKINFYHLFINKSAVRIDKSLDSMAIVLGKETVDAARAGDALQTFSKMTSKISKKSTQASIFSNILIILSAVAITAVWYFLAIYQPIFTVEVVSAISVILLTTVMEIIEACKGPDIDDETINISEERITKIYNELKKISTTVNSEMANIEAVFSEVISAKEAKS